MKQPAPQSDSTVLDFFGKALGCVVAFMTTMPTYEATYEYFHKYALRFSDFEYREVWEVLWIISLFFLIVTMTWAALSGFVSSIKKILKVAYTAFEIRRERKKWQ